MSPTLVVDPAAFGEAQVRVTGDEYRHLFRARRLAVGEEVRVVDGLGGARLSKVLSVSRSEAVLALGEPAASNEAGRRVELLVGALRPQRASWLVEKASEVGVAAVRFIATERALRTVGAKTLGRLRRVARSAVEQSGRSRLPEISGVHPWGEVQELIGGLEERWILEPGHPSEIRSASAGQQPVAVLIGPEGGFSDEESRTLRDHGCRPTGLGPRILRVETAALVAAAALLASDEPGPP